MEHYQKFAKLAVATVGTALSFAAVMKVNPASAADFSFNQTGYNNGAGSFSGTFSTNSTNSSIGLSDLTAFSGTYQGAGDPSATFDKSSLKGFNYNPGSSPSLSLNGLFSTQRYDFSITIPGSETGRLANQGSFTYTDYINPQTPLTTTQRTQAAASVVAAVPEPTNVMGVVLIGLGGLGGLLKKKVVSSQKAYL